MLKPCTPCISKKTNRKKDCWTKILKRVCAQGGWWEKWAAVKQIPQGNIPTQKPGIINWMKYRRADQENQETYQKGIVPEALDIKIWLAREENKKSWNQIGKEFYPSDDVENARRKVRCAHERVWKYLIMGKGHLAGAQAAWTRQQKKWEEENFVPGFFA